MPSANEAEAKAPAKDQIHQLAEMITGLEVEQPEQEFVSNLEELD